MAITGWKAPTANTVEAGSGTWTNDTNLRVDDGTEATFSLASKNTTGRWNRGDNFGFDSAIPAGATIDKVEIRAEWRVNNAGGIAHLGLQAFVSGGAVGAVRENSAEPTTLTTDTYDITADRAWTRADLLDGVLSLKARGRNGNNATDPSYRYDHIAVQVTYTEADTAKKLHDQPNPTLAPWGSSRFGFLAPSTWIMSQPGLRPRNPYYVPRLAPDPWRAILARSVSRQLEPEPAPFVPVEFPNPPRPLHPISLLTSVSGRTYVPTTPLRPVDFPNPERAKLVPQDWQFSVTPTEEFAPFRPVDLPTPRGVVRVQDWQFSSLYIPPAEEAAPFKPVDLPTPRRVVQVQDWNYSVLLSTLAIQPPAPIRPSDWPNPIRPRQPISLLTLASGRSINPPPPVVENPPIRQYDWPNPLRKRRSTTLLTSASGRSINPPPPVPPGPTDFGSPEFEYPTPTGALPHQLYGLQYSFNRILFQEVAVLPFKQLEWRNPLRWKFPTELRTWVQFQIPELGAPKIGWPTPTGPFRHDVYGLWITFNRLLLQESPGDPFRPVDAPNPRLQLKVQDWQHSILNSTLSIPPETPVRPFDWPNPLVGEYPTELRKFGEWGRLDLSLYGFSPPVPTFDWPLPKRRPDATALQTWVPNLLSSTLSPEPQPPGPRNWLMDIDNGAIYWKLPDPLIVRVA